jgi:hypothetical protein
VEIVSLLSHGEGEAMVRSYRRKFEWGLGKTTRQVLSCVLPISRITSLRKEILGFEYYEKESIGAAWARFSDLVHSSPDLSSPNHVLLLHFYLGLEKESTLYLDITARGLFAHKTTTEGKNILDRILENTSPVIETEPLQGHESSYKDPSIADFEPFHISSLGIETSPEPRTSKEEEIQPSKFSFPFEEDLYENLINTSNYLCERRPTAPPSSLNKAFLKKAMKEEWSEEMRRSSKSIRISLPSTAICCSIGGTAIEALHDPTIKACIMSEFHTNTFIESMPLVPTNRLFKSPWGLIFEY